MVFVLAFLATVVAFAMPAAADCMSSCQGEYYACSNAYDSRDCSTRRSICQQRCIMGNERQFGAIAFSPSTGAYGYSFEYRTRNQAEKRAIAECKARNGGDDCATEIWFYDNCGALAVGAGATRSAAYSADKAAASRRALEACNGRNGGAACEIKATVCSK
jgi:Domain of unknown function (DUF4189)